MQFRNKKLIFFFLSVLLVTLPFTIYAGQVGITNPIRYNTFPDLLSGIASAISVLIAGIGVVMVLVAGILYLLSAGSPDKVGTAKSALFYAILGIVVGLGANTIITTIQATKGTATTPGEVIANITNQLGGIIVGLGVVMVIVSGIFFLLSFGNPEKIGLAKKSLTYAIIGIIIGLLARTIVAFICSVFGIACQTP